MANQFGYSPLFTDRPETWIVDGYVSVDGYAAPTFDTVPSGVVDSVVLLGTGKYSIVLKQQWFALLFVDVCSEIPSTLSPAYVSCQLVSDNVGVDSVDQPSIVFQFNVAGTPTNLPGGSGFRFLILLKRSSA